MKKIFASHNSKHFRSTIFITAIWAYGRSHASFENPTLTTSATSYHTITENELEKIAYVPGTYVTCKNATEQQIKVTLTLYPCQNPIEFTVNAGATKRINTKIRRDQPCGTKIIKIQSGSLSGQLIPTPTPGWGDVNINDFGFTVTAISTGLQAAEGIH